MKAWLCGLVTSVISIGAFAAPPDPDRQQELVYLLRQDCGSCHGMQLTGGLGPPLTSGAIGSYAAEYLEAVILKGRPGTAMPPFDRLLTPDEARWLAEYLISREAR
jgi:cytochrome c55X